MSQGAPHRGVVLVTGADLAPQATALLQDYDIVYAGKTPGEDDLVRLCAEHQPEAIIVRYGRITRRVIDACQSLRVISKHGTGIDTIDAVAAGERGIAVKAAAGANAPAVAEQTWAMIFACAKDVVRLDKRIHEGHWDKATHKSLELKDRTIGLVGIGAIGARVAMAAMAFGMKVIAFDPYASRSLEGIRMVDLDTLLAQSDVLSLHCPLTDENRNMINAAALAKLKDGAIIVNTARGGLIDEEALVAALESGKVRAAGLDSFEKEPLTAPHRFQDMDNVILAPHIGGVTDNAYIAMGTGAANNVLAVLQTEGATS
ncbi:hydroxyacid dehydrogenase [Noviherbaspirillum pedocola]|uniref:Hydroxyacid dehydrogenase n=1 Tax=Noviherbaspirillum pedocola TaxID=2801341 RepID=A0A934SZI0_9BURK|nr:hydroxyacid dehydrogenase [Noviherbaspirillum pedocola]MBK4738155.1 hydroxyacid dehydrogenase [Noviherbaspirillum pedocola]